MDMQLKNKKLGIIATTMVATLLISGSAQQVSTMTKNQDVNVTLAEKSASANQLEKSSFQDVKGNSLESVAINKLVKDGYIDASNANFLPTQQMSMQYLAKLIVDTGLVKGEVVPVDSPNLFASNVQMLINAGVLPATLDVQDEKTIANTVSQEELSSIFAKIFKLEGDNPLVDNAILKDSEYNPNKNVTRGDFAVQLYGLLGNSGKISPNAAQEAAHMKERKVSAAVASTTPIAPAMVAKAASTKVFKDVSKKSPYYSVIHEMRDMGIISGYADNTFKPSEPINRQNGAALLTRYTPMKYTGSAKFPTLSDVTKNNGNYTVLVEFQKLGIYDVKSNGKVYPTLAMTRGEMAKSIAVAFNLKTTPTKKSSFKDVKASNEYSPYIEALKKAGITSGYEDGTFKADTSLSRAHFAVFMHRAINKVGKPVQEKPNTDTGTTKPPVVDEKPVAPPEISNPVPPPVQEKPSVGDFKEPTEYTGDFKYVEDGRVKFEDKKLEDYPLYAMPDYENDYMHYGGLTYKEHNAMNEKILVDRKGAINVTGNSKTTLRYNADGKLSDSTVKILTSTFKPYGLNDAEIYRLITYLYYTGDVYKADNFTAYIEYSFKDGYAPALSVSRGAY